MIDVGEASDGHKKRRKKYHLKYPKVECGPVEIIAKNDVFRYFTEFLSANGFSIRKRIKFEAGYARGDDTPLVVSSSLSTLKFLQSHFSHPDSTSSPSSSSPLTKTQNSPITRILHLHSSPLNGQISTPHETKFSSLASDTDSSPKVKLVRDVKLVRSEEENVVRKISSSDKVNRLVDHKVSKTNSEITQFHLKLGYEE